LLEISKELTEAVDQSVRINVLADAWPRYRSYRVDHADGDAYATAELPAERLVGRWSELAEEQQNRLLFQDPLASNQQPLYFPLTDAQDLFLHFARQEPTEEAWQAFLNRYGTLGPDPRRDVFSRFCEEVRRAGRVLRLYEAATAKPVPDVEAIARIFGEDGMLQDQRQWAKKVAPVDAGRWALREVDLVAKDVLRAETFADFYYGDHGESPLGSWGFRSLLGALWLQFFFLRISKHEPQHCKARDCNKLLGPGDKGEKATYSNKRFCSKACGERDRYHRRKLARRKTS
jgi:hypothetical protein